MALTLDIIGGTTFIASFTVLLRWFLKVRGKWDLWLQDPGASTKTIVDQARRQALTEVFQAYEEERQYVATDSRNAAIDDLAIPENDFPSVTGDQDLVALRRRFKNCIRQVEESIGQSLPHETANASSAMGRSRYGLAIEHVIGAHKAAWKVRWRRVSGRVATIVGLIGAITAPAAAVLFSLMLVRDVQRFPTSTDYGLSDFEVLVLAWVSQVLILIACVVLNELTIRRQPARAPLPVSIASPQTVPSSSPPGPEDSSAH